MGYHGRNLHTQSSLSYTRTRYPDLANIIVRLAVYFQASCSHESHRTSTSFLREKKSAEPHYYQPVYLLELELGLGPELGRQLDSRDFAGRGKPHEDGV